jgi:RimJ/RimL family protein N-acetyltransferase
MGRAAGEGDAGVEEGASGIKRPIPGRQARAYGGAMQISGPRVSLREFGPGDASGWVRVAGDDRVTRYASWAPITTPDEAVAWLREAAWAAAQNPRRAFRLAVQDNGSGELIGGAALDVLSRSHRQGEIGVYLRPDLWGRGLGSEVIRLLMRHAFGPLELHRVQATADPENLASQRMLQRLGMRQEGHLRDRYLSDGKWRDRVMFAITRPEWTEA